MKKILFAYAPFCTPSSPPYAITKLYSFMKNNLPSDLFSLGVIDLNVKFFNINFPEEKILCQSKNPTSEMDVSIEDFKKEFSTLSSQENGKLVRGETPLLLKELLDYLLESKPDVVAFSIVYSSQAFYTLALIQELKKKGITTIIGGPAVNPKLISEADYFLSNEIKLYDYFMKEQNGVEIYNNKDALEKLNYSSLLDYSLFDHSDYFVSDLVMPIKTSSCCYYQKCTFCTHHANGIYDEFSLNDIEQSIRLSDVKYVFLIDDMIHKKRLLDIAVMMKNLGVKWMCQLRPTKDLDRETLKILFDSGLRQIIWGVESGSNRILSLMKKGTNVEDMSKVLEDSFKVGISNIAYVMFGFPTETKDEFVETIDFLKSHSDYIDLISHAVFGLQKEAYIYSHPEEFDISSINLVERTVLEPRINYVVDSGMSNDEAKKMVWRYRKTLAKLNKYPKVMNYFREQMFLRVINY